MMAKICGPDQRAGTGGALLVAIKLLKFAVS
jgi:hypothetical protein